MFASPKRNFSEDPIKKILLGRYYYILNKFSLSNVVYFKKSHVELWFFFATYTGEKITHSIKKTPIYRSISPEKDVVRHPRRDSNGL